MSAQLFGLYYYYSERRVRSTLPLLNVRVDASIKEVAAQVKLVQTFGNDANHPIEAFYSFPIPARAAVCSFAMIKQDGTRVNGRVQERGEARRTYTNAIRQGQQASLVEQQHPDVFHIAVGNIPSKEQVKVELVYATELAEDEENDSIRFYLPTCIGTRYGQTPKLMLSFIRNPFSNPFYTSNNAFLDLSVRVETIAPISKIGCPSHTVSTELGPDPTLPNFKQLPFSHYARVSLSSESALDKDFVLAIKSAGLDAPRCVAEVHPSHDTVAVGLTLVPRFTLPEIARQEYIILVDRSGSMEGARMTAARRALVVMLRSLPVKDCLFQIMSFGAGCSALWARGSKPYNQEMLDKATAHVDGMRANYGGTEMRNALQQCFAARTSGRPTSVLVLTDGETWDLEAVLDTVKNAVAAAPDDAPLRVSVLGIGDAVSTAMCEGIARVGNGACVILGENETSFTGKIVRLLKAAKTPLISNISVDWGRPVDAVKIPQSEEFEMVDKEHKASLNIFDESVDPTRIDEVQVPSAPPVVLPPPSAVQQSPFKIRNLFPGTRLNIYAILQGRQIPDSVVIRGSTPDGATIELPIPITPNRLPNDPSIPPAIHALAARKIIQDLEDGQHELIQSIENPDDTDLLARTVKASVIRLGTTYSIASSHTSFVAVDEVGPIRVVEECAMLVADAAPPPPPPSRAAAPAPRRRGRPAPAFQVLPAQCTIAKQNLCDEEDDWEGIAETTNDEDSEERMSLARRLFQPVANKAVAPPPDYDPIEALARLQSFDGRFSTAVFALVDPALDLQGLRALFPTGSTDVLVATVLAMAFLGKKFGAEREAWEAIYVKAQDYARHALGVVEVEVLEKKVQGLIA